MNALITGLGCPKCRRWLNWYEAKNTIVCQNHECTEYGVHYEVPVIELKLSRKEAE